MALKRQFEAMQSNSNDSRQDLKIVNSRLDEAKMQILKVTHLPSPPLHPCGCTRQIFLLQDEAKRKFDCLSKLTSFVACHSKGLHRKFES